MDGGFDGQRAVVVAGPGVVARFPGVVCVAGPGSPEALRTLLDLCERAAGSAPGRPLGRSLARWLAGPDAPDDLALGTVSAAGDQVAVFLSGDVDVALPGTGQTLSGLDAAAWTDRLIPYDGGTLVLALTGTPLVADAGSADGARGLDLRSGVVPGSGVALLPDGAGPAETPAGETPSAGSGQPTGAHAPADPAPPPAVAAPPAPQSPRRSARIDGSAEAAQRPPLADGFAMPTTPADPRGAGHSPGRQGDEALTERSREPVAHGYVCVRGHLNDPRSHFCVLCGIRMNERTGVLTTGPRPPLGLLVFDDGSTYTVDAEYVVGRTPEADARVRSAELRALIVQDRGGTVSRVHAEIRVREWDVILVDAGSRNGTFVVAPGNAAWQRIPGGRPVRLVPGTRVRLGHQRTFLFESPSGVR